MRAVALAGGVGSARFLAGLVRVIAPDDLTVIVNTGDDERMRGLHVSPDVDTVLYHLSGATDWDRGWGIADETFVGNDRYRELVSKVELDVDMQEWFGLGDQDLATNMFRTRLLDAGRTLSEAIDALRRAMDVPVAVLPMSDDPVRTELVTTSGEHLDFQTYFVRRRHADEIAEVILTDAGASSPAPGVVEAIAGADVLIVPPSNPVVTIAPMLAVPGIRNAIVEASGTRVAVSPIVGGASVKGPLDALMGSLGHEVSALGVARIYEGLIDRFVIDTVDADQARAIQALGLEVLVTDTIMTGPQAAARLAKELLDDAA